MSAVTVEFLVEPSDTDRMFDFLTAKMSNVGLVAFMRDDVRPYLNERARARFAGEGDGVTGSWMPLRPATVGMREKAGFPGEHPINVRTGKMRRFVTESQGTVFAGTYGAVAFSTPRKTSGVMADKLRTAQEGDAKTRTVARPVIGLGPEDATHIRDLFRKYLEVGW